MKPLISTWNQFLLSLADELVKDNVRKIKFILGDRIPAGVLEKINDAHDLLNELDKRNIISSNDLSMLSQLLAAIGRNDLVSKLKYYTDEKNSATTSKNNATISKNNTTTSKSNATTSINNATINSVLSSESFVNFVGNASNQMEVCTMHARPTNQSEVCSMHTSHPNQLEEYSMHNDPCGICIIFSNYFDKEVIIPDENKSLNHRLGNGADEMKLKETFSLLNFNVLVYRNSSSKEIVNILYNDLKNQSIENCFVCCILSHGFRNGVYGSDGSRLTFEELWTTVNDASSEKLKGKPKLFFIQACQSNIDVDEMSLSDIGLQVEFQDCLTSVATISGKVAFRDKTFGSWYIQKLCEILEKRAIDSSLLDMLTELNSIVAIKEDFYEEDGIKKKATQMPTIQSCTLSKKLFFRPLVEMALSQLHIY